MGIDFTGGEPTIHQFFDFIHAQKTYPDRTSPATNGCYHKNSV